MCPLVSDPILVVAEIFPSSCLGNLNVHGFLNVPGQSLCLPVYYGKTFWADWVS